MNQTRSLDQLDVHSKIINSPFPPVRSDFAHQLSPMDDSGFGNDLTAEHNGAAAAVDGPAMSPEKYLSCFERASLLSLGDRALKEIALTFSSKGVEVGDWKKLALKLGYREVEISEIDSNAKTLFQSMPPSLVFFRNFAYARNGMIRDMLRELADRVDLVNLIHRLVRDRLLTLVTVIAHEFSCSHVSLMNLPRISLSSDTQTIGKALGVTLRHLRLLWTASLDLTHLKIAYPAGLEWDTPAINLLGETLILRRTHGDLTADAGSLCPECKDSSGTYDSMPVSAHPVQARDSTLSALTTPGTHTVPMGHLENSSSSPDTASGTTETGASAAVGTTVLLSLSRSSSLVSSSKQMSLKPSKLLKSSSSSSLSKEAYSGTRSSMAPLHKRIGLKPTSTITSVMGLSESTNAGFPAQVSSGHSSFSSGNDIVYNWIQNVDSMLSSPSCDAHSEIYSSVGLSFLDNYRYNFSVNDDMSASRYASERSHHVHQSLQHNRNTLPRQEEAEVTCRDDDLPLGNEDGPETKQQNPRRDQELLLPDGSTDGKRTGSDEKLPGQNSIESHNGKHEGKGTGNDSTGESESETNNQELVSHLESGVTNDGNLTELGDEVTVRDDMSGKKTGDEERDSNETVTSSETVVSPSFSTQSGSARTLQPGSSVSGLSSHDTDEEAIHSEKTSQDSNSGELAGEGSNSDTSCTSSEHPQTSAPQIIPRQRRTDIENALEDGGSGISTDTESPEAENGGPSDEGKSNDSTSGSHAHFVGTPPGYEYVCPGNHIGEREPNDDETLSMNALPDLTAPDVYLEPYLPMIKPPDGSAAGFSDTYQYADGDYSMPPTRIPTSSSYIAPKEESLSYDAMGPGNGGRQNSSSAPTGSMAFDSHLYSSLGSKYYGAGTAGVPKKVFGATIEDPSHIFSTQKKKSIETKAGSKLIAKSTRLRSKSHSPPEVPSRHTLVTVPDTRRGVEVERSCKAVSDEEVYESIPRSLSQATNEKKNTKIRGTRSKVFEPVVLHQREGIKNVNQRLPSWRKPVNVRPSSDNLLPHRQPDKRHTTATEVLPDRSARGTFRPPPEQDDLTRRPTLPTPRTQPIAGAEAGAAALKRNEGPFRSRRRPPGSKRITRPASGYDRQVRVLFSDTLLEGQKLPSYKRAEKELVRSKYGIGDFVLCRLQEEDEEHDDAYLKCAVKTTRDRVGMLLIYSTEESVFFYDDGHQAPSVSTLLEHYQANDLRMVNIPLNNYILLKSGMPLPLKWILRKK